MCIANKTTPCICIYLLLIFTDVYIIIKRNLFQCFPDTIAIIMNIYTQDEHKTKKKGITQEKQKQEGTVQQSLTTIGQDDHIIAGSKDRKYNKFGHRLKHTVVLKATLNQHNTQQRHNELLCCLVPIVKSMMHISHGPQDRSGIPTLHCHSNSLDHATVGILLLGCPLHLTSHLPEELLCFWPKGATLLDSHGYKEIG